MWGKEGKIKLDEKTELLKKAEVSLTLDGYDDIFSDFDSRAYNERALSDDFLVEIKKASLSRYPGKVELRFLIPAISRNLKNEILIQKRLKEHFRKHHTQLRDEIKGLRKKGAVMGLFGAIMIGIAAFLDSLQNTPLWMHIAEVILEPAGWFTGWTGLDQLYYTPRELEQDHIFYHRMEQADVTFHSY